MGLPTQTYRTSLPEGALVAWRPQSGPQSALLACPFDEIFFGGARGGGKTDGMLGEWAQHAAMHGRWAIGVFFRKTLTQLEEAIERAKQIYEPIGAVYKTQAKTFIMPGGARLKFRSLERDDDAQKYQGHSYTRIYFEELTNWANPSPINKLRATLRNAHAGVDTKFMATGNPGGPGHQWVKARYIDPQPNGYLPLEETMTVPGVDPETMMIRDIQITTTRVFIPSKLQDNKLLMLNDPGYVANLHLAGSEELVRAWLDGDWDVIDGAYFDEFRKERHIMTRIDLPAYLQRFRSFDWGSAKPFSCGFWAVSDGTIEHPDHGYLIPRGAMIRYREWYGQKKGQPNVGLKLTAEDVGIGIVKRSGDFNFSNDVSDPAAFAQDGGPSIAERMYTATHGALPFYRADNKRIPGWDQLRWRLKGNEDGIPMIYFMDTCLATIRTLPALQHDEHNAEDVDTASEDHAPDEIRYACMSRPITKPKPKEKPPMGTVQDLTMNELWDTTSNNRKKSDRI